MRQNRYLTGRDRMIVSRREPKTEHKYSPWNPMISNRYWAQTYPAYIVNSSRCGDASTFQNGLCRRVWISQRKRGYYLWPSDGSDLRTLLMWQGVNHDHFGKQDTRACHCLRDLEIVGRQNRWSTQQTHQTFRSARRTS